MIEKLLPLLKEPSTYAGFAGLAAAFGVSTEEYDAVAATLVAIFSAVAVFMREKGAS